MQKTKGFSLLEVFLGLILSLFVCLLLFKIIVNTDNAWRRQQKQIAVIEKALVTKALLQSAIAHAGYLGCQGASGDITIVDHLHAYKDVHPWLQVRPNKLDVMYLSPEATPLLTAPDGNEVITSDDASIKPGDVIVVADCRHAEIVKVARVSVANQKEKIYLEQSLLYGYEGFGCVGELVVNQFFLKNTSRLDEKSRRVKSLYMRNTKLRKQETVLGVSGLFFKRHNENIDVDLTFSQGEHYGFSAACENC